MELSKTVPARKVKFEATACQLDFMQMTQRFREIRAKSRNPMDKCHWCKHSFCDGEMMALALTLKGNKTLCRECGEKLLASIGSSQLIR